MANFQLNTFVSNGFGYAFKNFANFCHFNALNNNPALASNDMTKKTRVQLQYFNKTARFKHLSLPPLPPRVYVCNFTFLCPLIFPKYWKVSDFTYHSHGRCF